MDNQTIEYFTVISNKPYTLDENVNAKLAQGWELQGGVSVCVTITPFGTEKEPDIWFHYAQAMIRKKEKDS